MSAGFGDYFIGRVRTGVLQFESKAQFMAGQARAELVDGYANPMLCQARK
jgi:hypothetical protein